MEINGNKKASEEIDIKELQSVIKDYKGTIAKLKNSAGLRNYHKIYLKGLKARSKVASEKILEKVQQLIPPGIGTDYNFRIYSFLESKCNYMAIDIPIIESLIFDSFSEDSPIFLCNEFSGKIHRFKGQGALNMFYSKLALNMPEGEPICVFKPVNGKKCLFSDINNLKNFVENSQKIEGIFQKFINSSNDHSSIFRVHWKMNSKSKGYLISNNQNIRRKKIQEVPARIRKEKNLKDRKDFKFDEKNTENLRNFSIISDMSYAGKSIEEESSNQVELNVSILHNLAIKGDLEMQIDEENDVLKYTMPKEDCERFIVTGRSSFNSIANEVKSIHPEIVEITAKTTSLMVKSALHKKKKIREITLDFIKDPFRSWVLLKIDKILIDEHHQNFTEIKAPGDNNLNNSLIPMLFQAKSRKNSEILQKIIINTEHMDNEPQIMHQRTIIKQEAFPKIKNIESYSKMTTFEEKFNKILSKIDKFHNKTYPKIPDATQSLVMTYEKNFSTYAIGLKKQASIKKQSLYSDNINEIDLEESAPATNSFKSVIKEYDSMMVHVRRLNLKKKKSLQENYGGENFWKKAISTVFKKILDCHILKGYFSNISKESFHKMSNGLNCVFNSNISIEFRREVRQKHKGMNVQSRDFILLRNIFMNVLNELGVQRSDLEIIFDNFNSFQSSIVKKNK